jgi:hypothetical protein
MDRFGTKTQTDRENEEAERLVRPVPKVKPPRRDLRRERMNVDRDPDTDADPDLKGDPDLSMNYKTIGGSDRELVRFVLFARDGDKVKVRRKKDDKVVEVSPETLKDKEKRTQYKSLERDEEQGASNEWGSTVSEFNERLKTDHRLKGVLSPVLTRNHPDGPTMWAFLTNYPDTEIGKFFPKVEFPSGIKTVGDLSRALKPQSAKPQQKEPPQSAKPAPKGLPPPAKSLKLQTPSKAKQPTPSEEDDGDDDIHARLNDDEALRSVLSPLLDAKHKDNATMWAFVENQPNLPVKQIFPKVKMPKGIDTLGDLGKALRVPPAPKPAPAPTQSPPASSPLQDPTTESSPAPAPAVAPAQPPAGAAPSSPAPAAPPAAAPPQPALAPAPGQPPAPAPGQPPAPAPEQPLVPAAGQPDQVPAKPPKAPKEKAPKAPKEKPIERRVPSEAEVYEARRLALNTFPPDVAVVVAEMHPDDAREVVAQYNRFKKLPPIGAEKISSHLERVTEWTLDPTKVAAPKKVKTEGGNEVELENLPEEQKAEALRKHQLQVVAASAALRENVINSLRKGGSSRKSMAPIADFMLESRHMDPEQKLAVARERGRSLFVEASADPDTYVDERFGTHVPNYDRSGRTNASNRSGLIKTIQDPAAQSLMVARFQGEDYRDVRDRYLGYGSPDRITDQDSASKIFGKLRDIDEWFKSQAKAYPKEAVAMADDPSALFRARVRLAIEGFDPKKSKNLSAKYAKYEADVYDRDYKEYKKAFEGYEKSLDDWRSNKADVKPFPPTAPMKPPEYDSVRGAKPSMDDLYGLLGGKTAAYSSYHQQESQMAESRAADREAIRVAIYHGVDPNSNPEAEALYARWEQAHVRDLGEPDYSLILKAARAELTAFGSPEGLVPDTKFRAALDLAIRSVGEGRYSGAITASLYNDLLARLAGENRDETLLTIRAAKRNPKPVVSSQQSEPVSAAPQPEDVMTTNKISREEANQKLAQHDRAAALVQRDFEKWAKVTPELNFEMAKIIVNALDKEADRTEVEAFGVDSFQTRQETIVTAKVIQKDSDEGYMGTFDSPMSVHQKDADEGYMSQFEDDQSTAVNSGKSTTGRPLAP